MFPKVFASRHPLLWEGKVLKIKAVFITNFFLFLFFLRCTDTDFWFSFRSDLLIAFYFSSKVVITKHHKNCPVFYKISPHPKKISESSRCRYVCKEIVGSLMEKKNRFFSICEIWLILISDQGQLIHASWLAVKFAPVRHLLSE